MDNTFLAGGIDVAGYGIEAASCKAFDLEDYSWKILQKAYERYEQTGSIGDELCHWLKIQEVGV